jgi:hypothetical protein
MSYQSLCEQHEYLSRRRYGLLSAPIIKFLSKLLFRRFKFTFDSKLNLEKNEHRPKNRSNLFAIDKIEFASQQESDITQLCDCGGG